MNAGSRGWLLAAIVGAVSGALAGAWWTSLYSSNPENISSPAVTATALIAAGIVIVGAAGVLLAAMRAYRPLGVQILIATVAAMAGVFVVGFIGVAAFGPG